MTWQLLTPQSLRQEIFRQLHSALRARRFGVSKTLAQVRQRFYWSHHHQDVRNWCRNCDLCASRKGPRRKPRAAMQQYNTGSPMERMTTDVMGPLPLSTSGNRYLVIVMDYFTKWPEAFAVPNQETGTVVDALVKQIVCRLGVPLELHSDQGRNFESTIFWASVRPTPLHSTPSPMGWWNA